MTKTYVLKESRAPYIVPQEIIPPAEPLILMQADKPVAALLPIAEYERYRAWRNQDTNAAAAPDANERAWLAMQSELLKTQHGQFVCFREGTLIDSNQHEPDLIERVRAKFPDGPLYVQEVCARPCIYHIHSPHLVMA